jgi:hypothetical protein
MYIYIYIYIYTYTYTYTYMYIDTCVYVPMRRVLTHPRRTLQRRDLGGLKIRVRDIDLVLTRQLRREPYIVGAIHVVLDRVWHLELRVPVSLTTSMHVLVMGFSFRFRGLCYWYSSLYHIYIHIYRMYTCMSMRFVSIEQYYYSYV